MNYHHRRKLHKAKFLLLLTATLFIGQVTFAQDGKTVFQTNCSSCHNPYKKSTGPALLGAYDRWGGNEANMKAWIKNPTAFAEKDDYAKKLLAEYSPTVMTAFSNLSDAEIAAVIKYIKEIPPQPTDGGGKTTGEPVKEQDNTLLFGVLTLILAVIGLILLQVNANLKKLTDDKEGIDRGEPIPFYRNKTYLATAIIGLFVVGGYLTVQGAIGLGRNKDYQPEQPIYYSHKVHAGINQINCLYCHGGAQEGKHANIPSVNVCMNCHMQINEYTGASKEKLYREDGSEVNGTAEIQKLYKYAGWDATSRKYTGEGKPIEWIKIHNLPDHVYFNHSQHIKAGKVQCQTCHGEITNMGEVKQFAELSMGWCVNCHRETQVQFKENGFYSIYEKFHKDLKDGKLDSTKGITVEKIGGTECQKCHY
ncbi:MAG: c-type cytochrome [Sphingobacteriales bacterium]|nr:c-type cytochrome [Sphingobacteriales bacterium]